MHGVNPVFGDDLKSERLSALARVLTSGTSAAASATNAANTATAATNASPSGPPKSMGGATTPPPPTTSPADARDGPAARAASQANPSHAPHRPPHGSPARAAAEGTTCDDVASSHEYHDPAREPSRFCQPQDPSQSSMTSSSQPSQQPSRSTKSAHFSPPPSNETQREEYSRSPPFDIICFQELFAFGHPWRRRAFLRTLSRGGLPHHSAHKYNPPPDRGATPGEPCCLSRALFWVLPSWLARYPPHLLDRGLSIVSRHRVLATDSITFSVSEKQTADAWVAKGVQYALIEVQSPGGDAPFVDAVGGDGIGNHPHGGGPGGGEPGRGDDVNASLCHRGAPGNFGNGGGALAESGGRHLRVHVFNTHLQAHEGPTYRAVRKQQTRELAAFVSARAPHPLPAGEVLLLCGDYNIDACAVAAAQPATCDSEEYLEMVTILRDVTGHVLVDILRESHGGHPPTADYGQPDRRRGRHKAFKRLDYIFMGQGPQSTGIQVAGEDGQGMKGTEMGPWKLKEARAEVVEFRVGSGGLDARAIGATGRKCSGLEFLSDHFGVMAQIEPVKYSAG
eukprot:jgi/Mesvir1/2458/Mv17795-RA.4